jgi:hypothetical protein
MNVLTGFAWGSCGSNFLWRACSTSMPPGKSQLRDYFDLATFQHAMPGLTVAT